MPTINHTITVTINGIDRSSLLLRDSLYVKTAIGNKGDVASFVIRDESDSFTPADWDEVVIDVDGSDIFGGYITSRSAAGVGPGSNKVAHWNIECRSWDALLDSVIVARSYVDIADTDILYDLFDTYLQVEGFDVTTDIVSVDEDVDITFENVTMRKVLDLLAETVGAKWHIGPNKSLYWYAPSEPDDAAFDIDVVAPDEINTYDVLAGSLSVSTDAGVIINRARIFGGEELTDKVTDTFAADGATDTFGPFTYKPGTVWKVTFTMAGVLHTNFADRIGYEPEDSLSIDGGDFNTLINLEQRYVKIQKTDGSVPDNGTNVTVIYYKLEPVEVTVNDVTSQDFYGRVFEQAFYDEQLTSRVLATAYGERVLDEYAFGRETIQFSVTEHGLLPGRLLTVNAPVLTLDPTYNDALALENYNDVLLLEDGSRLMLENYGESRKYLIQNVTIRTAVTGSDEFMVIATVSAGKYIPTIIDSLATATAISGGIGRLPAKRTVGSLDRVSNNLGEVVAGRAAFTDGGTAPFAWDAYNDHTGAVIGLEEDGSNAYGVVYILDDGEIMAKLGHLDGLPAVSGGTPTGWGLYTQNGYFSGVITASEMIGGTIATTAMPINSSNPGVYMTSAGIFGYGTLGLTFALPSDPTQRPIFSSGTILNTVYEVTTASVLRTGTVNPRIQIDNSGIFAYDTGGTLRFSVDVNTGRLTASQGTFSGSVTASQITGGTVIGAVFTGGTVTQGTVSAAAINGGTITGGYITGGTVTGALVTGGTVSSASGNVYLDSLGFNIVSPSSLSVGDNRNIKWRRTSGGTVTGEISTVWDGSIANMYITAGLFNAEYGITRIRSFDNASSNYSNYEQYPSQYDWQFVSTMKMRLTSTELVTAVNVRPDSSANNRNVGDASYGYRYLYLKDDNGNVRRVSINSSGVLTVT